MSADKNLFFFQSFNRSYGLLKKRINVNKKNLNLPRLFNQLLASYVIAAINFTYPR